MFDHCFFLNLDRRPDRWQAFCERLPHDWPFPTPTRFSGVDGRCCTVPESWQATPGAYGCMLSHRMILERAADNDESVLILEDDAVFRPGFASEAIRLLTVVPRGWHQLYFGGQHDKLLPPEPVVSGLVRCCGTRKTHAYAVSPDGAAQLAIALQAADTHADCVFHKLHRNIAAYAASPWLVGQAAGISDIFGSQASVRENFWDEVPHG